VSEIGLLKELLEPQEKIWLKSWRFAQKRTLSCAKAMVIKTPQYNMQGK